MSTSLKVSFYPDGRFKVEGFIDHKLSKFKLKELFTQIINQATHIKDTYIKTISNDGKIVGHERAMIISDIDQLFKTLILFRQVINSTAKNSAMLDELELKVDFDFFASRFTGFGHISSEESHYTRTFIEWYDKEMLESLKKLIHVYKEACEDGVISIDELKSINTQLDEVFYQLIIIRYQVEYMVINR